MKKLLTIAAALLAVQFSGSAPALAEDQKLAPLRQQRLRDCNKDAAGMQGDARKLYMKDCLAGRQVENQAARAKRRAEHRNARQAQQEKVQTCNGDVAAKALKGDARRDFMSQCLKAE